MNESIMVALEAVPPPPPRFTQTEWDLQTCGTIRISNNQQALADVISGEIQRIIEDTKEVTKCNKLETEHQMRQRFDDIKFNRTEILTQRKEVCIEIDNLLTYNERIKDAMESLKERCLKICKNCLILREHRLGIDLCFDEVEIQLRKELEVIQGGQKLLDKTAEQGNEQIRRLRSTIYFMDMDLKDKDDALKIDSHNAVLKETSLSLSIYHGLVPLDPSNITRDEWQQFTTDNIEKAAKEINSARQLRSYVDTLLKQVIEDLTEQYHKVNEAFRQRIEQVKNAKTKLELQHHEIVRKVKEMTDNIVLLKKAIGEKEGYTALTHTRMGNRAQRPGMELSQDQVQICLLNEVVDLRSNVSKLQQVLAEAYASHRYLLRIQIQLEEDINVKANSLKIDEVDCMTLRQCMDYHAY